MLNCVKEFCRSVLVLALYLGFHLLSFAVTTSLCIGLALLLVFTIEVWFGIVAGKSFQVPQHIALGLTIIFIYDAVRFSISVSNSFDSFRTRLDTLRKEFPFMLIAVPWTLYAVLILGSFSQLYWQYEATHTDLSNTSWSNNSNGSLNSVNKIGNNSPNNMTETEATLEGPDYRNNVTIFVFALAILVFCSASIIQTDLMKKLTELPDEHEMEFCVGTFSLLLCQIVLTVGYSLPFINSFVLLGFLKYSQGCIFLQVNVIAVLTGVCAGFLESRDPFPVQGDPPYYCFENQARARSFFLQFILLPLIPYSFFDSSSTQEYDPDYPAFSQYTVVISLTVLHITKILSTTYILNERRRQRDMERLEWLRVWYMNTIMNRRISARNVAVVPAPPPAAVDAPQQLQLDINANLVIEEEASTSGQSPCQNPEAFAAQSSDRIVRGSNSNESDNNTSNTNSPSETTQGNSSVTSTSTRSEEIELLVPYPSRTFMF